MPSESTAQSSLWDSILSFIEFDDQFKELIELIEAMNTASGIGVVLSFNYGG